MTDNNEQDESFWADEPETKKELEEEFDSIVEDAVEYTKEQERQEQLKEAVDLFIGGREQVSRKHGGSA